MTGPSGDNIQVEITGTVAPLTTAMKEGAASVATASESMRASLNKVSVTTEQARQAWARSGGDLQKFAKELAGASGNIAAAQTTVAVAATKADPAVRQVTNAVRSMAFSAIGAAPGVSQLTGALAPMALSSPLMIGVLAGVAALAYAWEQVSKAAKAAEADQQRARSTLEGIRERGRNPVLGGVPHAIAQEEEHQLDLIAEKAKWQKKADDTVNEVSKAGYLEKVGILNNQITDSKNLIQWGHKEVERLETEHNERLAQQAETAANKRIAAAKDASQKLEAARVSIATAAAAKAKAFNDVLAATVKVGDAAGARIDARATKDAEVIRGADQALEEADRLGKQARREYAAEWKQVFDDVSGSFGRAIDAASTKAGFLREVWRSVWYDMVQTSARWAASEVSTWAAMELAKAGITKKSVTERVAAESWGAIKTIAIKTWEAIKWIALHAAKAAAAAWSALAGIPIIGPALGVAAAAATFAGVMALAKGIGGGGGGGAPSGAPAGGGGSGGAGAGRQAQNISIYAVDAKSFRQMAMRNRDVFTDVVAAVVKDGSLTPAKLGLG